MIYIIHIEFWGIELNLVSSLIQVKKKIRHALLAMDSPGKSGMPAFQRAKPSGGSMRAHFYVSDANESSGSSIGKGARPKGTLVHSNSVQVSFETISVYWVWDYTFYHFSVCIHLNQDLDL